MTNIILTELTCNETEDNLGSDECDLRIWADAHYYNRRKDMTNGEVWNLNLPLSFEQRVKIQLWDIDNPGFPLYDDHDHLGTVVIRSHELKGSAKFNLDGADYDIEWIAG